MKKGATVTKKTKHQRKHGFLSRASTHGGQDVLKRRRASGRKSIAV